MNTRIIYRVTIVALLLAIFFELSAILGHVAGIHHLVELIVYE